MRGSLQMRSFDNRVVPDQGLDALVLPAKVRKCVEAIISFEKARGMLFRWGFTDSMKDRQGTTCLLWGPPGTGKSLTAAAIGCAYTHTSIRTRTQPRAHSHTRVHYTVVTLARPICSVGLLLPLCHMALRERGSGRPFGNTRRAGLRSASP